MNQSISVGGTFLIYNQISLIQQFREESAAMLSHRRNSDFTLFDSSHTSDPGLQPLHLFQPESPRGQVSDYRPCDKQFIPSVGLKTPY